jgi:hypothetical protein
MIRDVREFVAAPSMLSPGQSRIRLRGNGSWELWVLIAGVAFLLFVVVPWIVRSG